MPLLRAASLADLERNNLAELVHEDKRYAICRVGGMVLAMEGTCPHRGGPLAQGALHGHVLVCPWHGSEFDCLTGETDFREEMKLEKYRVEIDGGDVLIDLP